MSYSHYDRLTALDAGFLGLEDQHAHMHVGSVGLFDAAPLKRPHGGVDFERIVAATEAGIAQHPRFRQKLAWVPAFDNPIWVDDDRFNLLYHLRHTALPAPGDLRQLKRLAGRIMSQQLDRGKPLWEMWFVEGIEGDRFAVISKLHHCMCDGISGADLLAAVLRVDPDTTVVPAPRWMPRPTPGPLARLANEAVRRVGAPLALLRGAGAALADPRRAWDDALDTVGSVGEALASSLVPATPTPLNGELGAHRRFDWTRLDLHEIKEIKSRLGGTVNDVVLAIVSGAMRRFLQARGEHLDQGSFRVMVPVSVRTRAQRGTLGNRVSFLMVDLPLDAPDPLERLRRVRERMERLKGSRQARGTEALEELSDLAFSSLFVRLARLGNRALAYNMVVTNVPGPPFPVYLLGAPLREIYPVVPLFLNQGLGIALFSYDGGLYWGFNADWDAVPDLHDVVGAVEAEFNALRAAAAATPTPLAARPRATRRARVRRPVGARRVATRR